MTTEKQLEQKTLIRNILVLISVLAVFFVMVFVYFNFSHSEQIRIEGKIRQYHDLTSKTALKILDGSAEIRVILGASNEGTMLQDINGYMFTMGRDLKNMQHAHEHYREEEYGYLLIRLGKQYKAVVHYIETLYANDSNGLKRLEGLIGEMEISLKQIYRQHELAANVQRKAYIDSFAVLDKWMFGISIILFIIGSIVLVRGIGQIRYTLARQHSMSLELSASENKLSHILASTADAIYGIDTAGLCTFANPACLKLLGYDNEDELLGQKMHELIHHSHEDGRHYPVKDSLIYKAFQGGMESSCDTEVFWHKDGSSFAVEYSSHPIIENGTATGSVVNFVDITERRQMQEELYASNKMLEARVKERTAELEKTMIQLQAENIERLNAESEMKVAMEKAETANQLKSDFLGRMSHELRTPMNAILGFGQLLEVESLSDDQKESVDEILMAGRHLLHLIDEVLDLSTIENGKLKVKMTDVALYDVVEESIALISAKAKERNIRIDNYITCADCIAWGDRTRVMEVIMNLLSNAVKYNKENGCITINMSKENDMFKLQVTDSGSGLTPEQQFVVFEPFNRLDAEYSDIEGTGIGLTIAKQLMDLMQGKIGVQSSEGEGCTFWIELHESINIAAVGPQEKVTTKQTIAAQKKSILYIEDNPANLRLVKNIIATKSTLSFLSSSNAEMGIEVARSKRPDLIILDLNLPGMDGYEALSRLRNYPETKDIPIIALSASAMPENITRGLMAGFKHYITKPINVDEFCAVLDHELGSARQAAER